jgi:hypothetical protein
MQLPLHNKGTPSQVLDLHMTHQAMRSGGFRVAPTSKKHPDKKSQNPTTRVEKLAGLVYGK